MIGTFFKKYTGILRRIKPLYWVANILNREKLQHIKHLYQEFEIRKPYFATISSKDFKGKSNPAPWMDGQPDLEQVRNASQFGAFDQKTQDEILGWPEKGFIHLEGFFGPDQVDRVNQEIDDLIKSDQIDFNYSGRKIMFAHQKSEAANAMANSTTLKAVMNFLLNKEVKVFSSINFLKGSEQRAHSDYIHMATYPDGYLIAAWIALEDVSLNNGTIFYYPGSHQLPYVKTTDYLKNYGGLFIPKDSNKRYEDHIETTISQNDFPKKDFIAKKGDVLIWHGNLIHGGNPILDEELTRKSMVIHYFAQGVIPYHEITQRPAYMD